MIRVLIAEDSPTARALLTELLESDPEITVAGQAATGADAVALAAQLRPDVITMDLDMPVLDGMEAIRRIMRESAAPIVVVSAGVADREVAVSMEAIEAGALAAIAKPRGPGAPDFERERARFLQTVKAMAGVKVVRRWAPVPVVKPRPAAAGTAMPRDVVGIAASTGGPAALHRILEALPRDFSPPIVIVQHVARGFAKGLAAWLRGVTHRDVLVPRDGEPMIHGTVYVAPDDHHLTVSRGDTLRLDASAPVGGFRPSATPLFSSIARVYGARSVGIILTGMGDDGVAGLAELHAQGGRVIAQDEASCVVFGMPGQAIARNVADEVLSVDRIAQRLAALAGGAR